MDYAVTVRADENQVGKLRLVAGLKLVDGPDVVHLDEAVAVVAVAFLEGHRNATLVLITKTKLPWKAWYFKAQWKAAQPELPICISTTAVERRLPCLQKPAGRAGRDNCRFVQEVGLR